LVKVGPQRSNLDNIILNRYSTVVNPNGSFAYLIGGIPKRYDFFQHPGMIKPLDMATPARHPIIPFLGQKRYDFTILGGGKLPVDTALVVFFHLERGRNYLLSQSG
jgi:hypothetical protein